MDCNDSNDVSMCDCSRSKREADVLEVVLLASTPQPLLEALEEDILRPSRPGKLEAAAILAVVRSNKQVLLSRKKERRVQK